MSEWWTYRLGDFLMFSPAVYGRMVERYHREWMPLPWLLMAVGLLLVALALSRKPWAGRVVLLVLALLWAGVGWAFFWQRYALINTAAPYVALAWWGQAALLAAAALWGPASGPALPRRVGVAVAAVALGLLALPLLGQGFGLMPGPTALATLGVLGLLRPHRGRWLLVVPVLALAAEALTAAMLAG